MARDGFLLACPDGGLESVALEPFLVAVTPALRPRRLLLIAAIAAVLLVGVMAPPVAMILITSAPRSISVRTRSSSAASSSATPPRNQQWPIGIVSARPAARMCGPLACPAAIRSRS